MINFVMGVRKAQDEDIDVLAKIWYDGWQDAHAAIMPAELARVRTLESFRERLGDLLDEVRVIGEIGDPLGFSMTKDDELYQLFVARAARGSSISGGNQTTSCGRCSRGAR